MAHLDTLDLRWGVTRQVDVGHDYDRCALEVHESYNLLIDTINLSFATNLHWWFELPASRNQMFSRIFHDCVCIALLHYYANKNYSINRFIVDEGEMETIIQQHFKSLSADKPIEVENKRFYKRMKLFLKKFAALTVIVDNIWKIGLCKLFKPGFNLNTKHQYILVDTFMTATNRETDRYFPNLFAGLPASIQQCCYFVPELINIKWRQLPGLFYQFSKINNRNIVFKYRFLKLKDTWQLFTHWLIINRLSVSHAEFQGCDLATIINKEIRSGKGFTSASIAFMNYRFAQRLSENYIGLQATIDWWENQPIDKGWNFGFNTFYPNIKTLGYNGMHGAYFNIRPLKSEDNALMLPKEVSVMGPAYIEDRKRYFSGFTCTIAPAFRYTWLWNNDSRVKNKNNEGRSVLVSMPIDLPTAKSIYTVIKNIASRHMDVNFNFKPHPVADYHSLFDDRPSNCQIVKGDMAKQIINNDIVICSGYTTVPLEVMAFNKHVIILTIPGERINAPVLSTLEVDLWHLVDNEEDCQKLILSLARTDMLGKETHSTDLRNQLFTATNNKTISNWLKLDT